MVIYNFWFRRSTKYVLLIVEQIKKITLFLTIFCHLFVHNYINVYTVIDKHSSLISAVTKILPYSPIHFPIFQFFTVVLLLWTNGRWSQILIKVCWSKLFKWGYFSIWKKEKQFNSANFTKIFVWNLSQSSASSFLFCE